MQQTWFSLDNDVKPSGRITHFFFLALLPFVYHRNSIGVTDFTKHVRPLALQNPHCDYPYKAMHPYSNQRVKCNSVTQQALMNKPEYT